jgi:hypothetical protein
MIRLSSSKEPYGALFADPAAFNEVFCTCFLHIDAVWTQRNAVRTDFGKIIGESCPAGLSSWLLFCPRCAALAVRIMLSSH